MIKTNSGQYNMVWSTLMSIAIAIVPAMLFTSILYLLSPRNNGILAVLKLLIIGVIVTIPVFICYSWIDKLRSDLGMDHWSTIILLSNVIIEEGWKLTGALLVIYRFKLKFNSWREAILIGFMVGAGFGFVENSFFVMNYFDSDSLLDLICTRKYMLGLSHPLYSTFAVLGLFFLYRFRLFLACLFLFLSIMLHFLHNMNILYNNVPFSLIYITMYIGIVAIFAFEKFKPFSKNVSFQELSSPIPSTPDKPDSKHP